MGLFIIGHVQDAQAVVGKDSGIKTFEDMKGKRVAAAAGTVPEQEFLKYAKKWGTENLYEGYQSENEVFLAVAQGKVDAGITTDTAVKPIARALAMEPDCMLFDEATYSLHPELVSEVLDTMRLLAEEGMTMICMTHEMGFARDVSDRVAYFHEGVMEEIGPPSQIFGAAQSEHTKRFLAKVR